ncbi:MAG: CBS domain-containing protein [Actinomycetota bacterium]|nr:CBS domain-containing protein [Actinomycetota bacterium]
MAQTTVREIMTPNPRSLAATASVADAARVMREADVGAVVVLKDDGTVCGIVTDRDITIRAVAEGQDPDITVVDRICSHDPASVGPDDDAEQAVRRMRQNAIRRLPVVEEGQPIGMLSLGDLAIERAPGSALADISAQPPNE